MNETFYRRCKRIVKELDLSYEQGIAREVILNELDNLEKQAEDYQKRFKKAIETLKLCNSQCSKEAIHILEDTEVEIIEEEKKIPEKLSFGDVSGTPKRASENDIIDKINEIIDYLNSKGE